MYQRVLLKLSGEALGASKEPVCFEKIEETAACLMSVAALGVEMGVVFGGGNIWRGRASGNMDRSRADHMGMLATAINALAMQDVLLQMGARCTVLSALDMPRVMDSFTARSAHALLNEKHILLFACGTGHPYFSTDTAAALRAAEIDADALLLAKNMDYVCSADPVKHPDAVRYKRLSYDKFIADNLQAMDQSSVCFCRDRNIPVRAFRLSKENILRAIREEDIGTLIDGAGECLPV